MVQFRRIRLAQPFRHREHEDQRSPPVRRVPSTKHGQAMPVKLNSCFGMRVQAEANGVWYAQEEVSKAK